MVLTLAYRHSKETTMLRDAHRGLEAMSAAAHAVKDERWADAQRALQEVQQIAGELMREVGDKIQEKMLAPKSEKGDRE